MNHEELTSKFLELSQSYDSSRQRARERAMNQIVALCKEFDFTIDTVKAILPHSKFMANGAFDGDYEHLVDSSLLPELHQLFVTKGCNSIYEFGCGNAGYSKFFTSRGIDCDASDGNPSTEILTGGVGYQLDLTIPFNKEPREAVLCLEVGEHVPHQYESILLQNITQHCRKILVLSWAVEGQTGTGHVNCRNNDYVISAIENKKFQFLEKETATLRECATLSWFKNTIMVFERTN